MPQLSTSAGALCQCIAFAHYRNSANAVFPGYAFQQALWLWPSG